MLILSELWIVWLFDTEVIDLSHLVTYMLGCISCYTGAYSPFFLLSRWLISHLTFIAFFSGHSFEFFYLWAFKGAWLLSFDHPNTYDSLVDRYVEAMIVSTLDYLVWDPLVETTTNSSSRVSWANDIWIITTLCQASWYSQMGCDTLFYSWFDHSDPFSGLRFVTTCHTGAFFPLSLSFNLGVQSYFFSLPFRATIFSQLWHSKSSFSFTVWHSKPSFSFTVWHSEPPFLQGYGI